MLVSYIAMSAVSITIRRNCCYELHISRDHRNLNKADSKTDSTHSTAEFVYEEFKKSHPQIHIGRPSRFLKTAI